MKYMIIVTSIFLIVCNILQYSYSYHEQISICENKIEMNNQYIENKLLRMVEEKLLEYETQMEKRINHWNHYTEYSLSQVLEKQNTLHDTVFSMDIKLDDIKQEIKSTQVHIKSSKDEIIHYIKSLK